MSECVEILNRWGESFSAFAWPMLWQSSLLIAVILAFDLMFARRIRSSIRYALWMVVLVKLLLPPALTLPTGATWWLWRPRPVIETPAIKDYTVSFNDSLPEALPPPTVPVVSPPPKLSADAWVLLTAAIMGVGLLSWLAFRWLGVAAKVRRAATAPVQLDGILEEARQLTGLRRRLRLKLIDDRHSPAVYGLFRPVILLPQTLANELSRRQLRAVLLHEAIHLRRGDVWVNCAQTLLQIAYWWHPLFWLANARIRRVREEAVDDAVMHALRDGADAYAPTLLEVAKFAFRRPLASLGLIGILESRSALRQRVERLVDYQAPRRPGITLLSLFGVFAFAAMALPMGQGPEKASNIQSSGPETSPSVTTNGVPADITVTRETSIFGHTNVVFDGRRDAIYRKLNQIHLTASYHDMSLSEVLHDLSKQSRELDPREPNLTFLFNPNVGFVSSAPISTDPNTGLQIQVNAPSGTADPTRIHIRLNLKSVSLGDVLNAACLNSDLPIKYSVEDYGIVFSAEATNSPQIVMGKFKMSATFISKLKSAAGYSAPTDDMRDVSKMAKVFFLQLGVNPQTVLYNDRMGELYVYATPQDLNVIQNAIRVLADVSPPQIHIKARFFEVPKKFFSSSAAKALPPGMTNGMNILTTPERVEVLQFLKSQKGVEELAEPEAVTLSQRRTIMRATVIQPVITNYVFGALSANPVLKLDPQIDSIETGPILDVVPLALSDGYTLNLSVTATLVEFFGYADSKGFRSHVETNFDGFRVDLPFAFPAVQLSRASATVNIFDGQTFVLFPTQEQESLGDETDAESQERVAQYIRKARKKQGDKVLVVLCTATLVDPAGNRIHSEVDSRFASLLQPVPVVTNWAGPDNSQSRPAGGGGSLP